MDKPEPVEIRERRLACVECKTERVDVYVFGAWTPGRCVVCDPPETNDLPEQGPPADEGEIATLRRMHAAGFNMRKYRNARFRTFRREHDGHALEAAREFAREIRDTKGKEFADRPWFYFFAAGASIIDDRFGRRIQPGKVGNQKTWLATAIARELVEARVLEPAACRFVTAEAIILATEATFRSGSEDSEARLIREYAKPELLIVDDFFVRPPSAHVARLFDEILKEREGKATGFTSNVDVPTIETFDPTLIRLTDRISGNCGPGAKYAVRFSGPSIRDLISRGEA